MSVASVLRGVASIQAIVGGVPTNVTAWANGILPQSQSGSLDWDEKKVMDASGFTAGKRSTDHHIKMDFTFKPTSDTLAHAKSATVFLAPYAKITFAATEAADFSGDWCLESGSKIEIKNDDYANYTLSCIRYLDSGQNTSMNTAPS